MNEELAKSEQVFPDGWRHVRFGDVATLQRGFDLPVQARTPGSFPVIGSNGVVGFHNEAKVPSPGVIIGRSGTIGKSFYTEGAYWPLNTGLYVKDFHGNDPLFLHFFFHVFDFGKYSAGVSVPTLNRNLVHEAIVCIPPLPEQRAIAAVLSKIQAAVEVQDKIVTTLKELKAATMAKLFREGLRGEPLKQTEIGEIPQSWEVVRFGDAVSIAEGQVDPKLDPYASMIHIGPENVEPDTGRLLECRTARDLGLISGKYLFRAGNIVYSKIRPYLRKSVLVDFMGLCSADMYPLTPNKEFDVRYIHTFTLSELFTRQAVSQQDRTGIPKLNREQLNSTLVPRPPLSEQCDIGQRMAFIAQGLDIAVRKRDALRSLFSSMLHLLMTGQVRVNNLKIEKIGM